MLPTIMEIMKERLDAGAENIPAWYGYRCASNHIACFNGIIKIGLDPSPYLRENAGCRNGIVQLSEDDFESLEGEVFFRHKLLKYGLGTWLEKDRVKKHPLWKAAADYDKKLLEDYVDTAFSVVRRLYSENKAMGIFLPDGTSFPALNMLFLGYGRSDLCGYNRLSFHLAELRRAKLKYS